MMKQKMGKTGIIRIRSLMRDQGFTQRDLAKKSKLSQSMVSRLLAGTRGQKNLSYATIRRIASALGTTTGWLLGDDANELPASGPGENLSCLVPMHKAVIAAQLEMLINNSAGNEADSMELQSIRHQDLANSCRDAIAAVLGKNSTCIHCAIKCYEPANKTVWTIGRSSIETRRSTRIGRNLAHKVDENSSFASIMGCSDGKNKWLADCYPCFSCDELSTVASYVDSGKDWLTWYDATLVFPIRSMRKQSYGHDETEIVGFLTFDSPYSSCFGLPSIFDYVKQPARYLDEVEKHDAYYVGRILSGLISMSALIEKLRAVDDVRAEEGGCPR